MTLRCVSRKRAITSWNRIMTAAAPSGAGIGAWVPLPLADGAGGVGWVSVVFIVTRGATGTTGGGVTREATAGGTTGAGLGERGASAP